MAFELLKGKKQPETREREVVNIRTEPFGETHLEYELRTGKNSGVTVLGRDKAAGQILNGRTVEEYRDDCKMRQKERINAMLKEQGIEITVGEDGDEHIIINGEDHGLARGG
jgi:hypothetical protein